MSHQLRSIRGHQQARRHARYRPQRYLTILLLLARRLGHMAFDVEAGDRCLAGLAARARRPPRLSAPDAATPFCLPSISLSGKRMPRAPMRLMMTF